jgi:hypothetical protein
VKTVHGNEISIFASVEMSIAALKKHIFADQATKFSARFSGHDAPIRQHESKP